MTVKEISEAIRDLPLFEGIDSIDSVIESYPPKEVTVSTGERYQTNSSLVLFLSGKADIVKESESRIAYLKSLSEPTLFGFATLFSSDEFISTMIAKTEVRLLLFGEDFLSALIKQDPEFSLRLVKLLCQKVRYLNRRIDF